MGLAAAGVVVTGLVAAPDVAAASAAQALPTAAVSLGDSYISGEAGRWQGNAPFLYARGDIWGTDRAAYNCSPDYTYCDRNPERVYGASYLNGCDRSDVAEIRNARLTVQERFNLACSGATTTDVLRRVDGGQWYKNEPPQADQLATVARRANVKLVAVSIGGNDLHFADILSACAEDFLKPWPFAAPCKPSQEPKFAKELADTGSRVQKALKSVRAAMASAGYRNSDYRLVLQSYPSPLPVGTEYRYPQYGYSRYETGGCPFFDSDSTWAHNSVVPRISTMLHSAARAEGADFLDLSGAFYGHEVCSMADFQASWHNTLANPVSPPTAEWVRFVDTIGPGSTQESLHPNAYGQLAFGDCLGRVWAAGAGSFSCSNSAGWSPLSIILRRIP